MTDPLITLGQHLADRILQLDEYRITLVEVPSTSNSHIAAVAAQPHSSHQLIALSYHRDKCRLRCYDTFCVCRTQWGLDQRCMRSHQHYFELADPGCVQFVLDHALQFLREYPWLTP